MHAILAAVTPVDAATGSITGYLLGYGPVGIFLLTLGWLMFKGWRLLPPDKEAANRETVRAEARADLLDERARTLAEKTRIEQERDEALKIARVELVPLMLSFNSTASALLPILQDLVRRHDVRTQEGRIGRSGPR